LEFATAELSTYQTGRVRKLLDDAIQATLVGTKTPAEALGSAQKKSEGLLKRYR
jgi:sn-glycerol 3-phosphate transport system substrate-binding protein